MKKFPTIPRIANAQPELLNGGHLWLQEKVDGANFRFSVAESGQIVFGDRSRAYHDEPPAPYRHVVRHIRENFDREAFRSVTDDPEGFVFFGEAMHHHTIKYDWERTPSFLGFDIWSEEREAFFSLDETERAFSRLNIDPINTVKKEVRAVDFNSDAYEIPRSAWYDGPAEGIVVKNKNGARAKLLHPRFWEVEETIPLEGDPTTLARRYATDRRIEKIVQKCRDREVPVTFDTVYDRLIEDIVREEHKELYHADNKVDMREFRSAVAARTRKYLDER